MSSLTIDRSETKSYQATCFRIYGSIKGPQRVFCGSVKNARLVVLARLDVVAVIPSDRPVCAYLVTSYSEC